MNEYHGYHVFPFAEWLFVQNSLFVWIVSFHQMPQCPKISLSMEYFPKDADSITRKQMSPPLALCVSVEMEGLGNRHLFSTSKTRSPGIQLCPTNLTEKLGRSLWETSQRIRARSNRKRLVENLNDRLSASLS